MNEEGKFEEKATDFFLPIATQFYDMRILGNTSCVWNEEFILNEYAPNILKPNVVFLFELLELNTSLIAERKTDLLTAELFYPVAWAYLRPLGTALTHMSRTRLQLYRYKFKYTAQVADDWPYDLRTPAVFLDFNFPKKTAYPSYLEVDLQFCKKSNEEIGRIHYSRAPWEKEMPREKFDLTPGPHKPDGPTSTADPSNKLHCWEKFLDQPSMLPDLRVFKFDTEAQGALRLEFSSKGKYLAVACTTAQKSKTLIKIFDITKAEHGEKPVAILRGHYDLIHDMAWEKQDKYLVTASADGSAKVWKVGEELEHANPIERVNYTENDSLFFLT